MSYILDALRQAERQRQQQSPAGPLHQPKPARGRPPLWLLTTTAALLLNAALVAGYWWQQAKTSAEAVIEAATPDAPPAPAPVTSATTSTPALLPSAATTAPPSAPAIAAPSAPPSAPATAAPSAPPSAPAIAAPSATSALQRYRGELTIDAHVHSPQPERRFVLVAGHSYREGEFIATGVRLEEITANGIIVSEEGRLFSVPLRP